MINKMERRRKAKHTKNVKEFRRPSNQLRRETNRTKVGYMKEIFDKIMDLQRKERNNLMYLKTYKLGETTTKATRTFGVEARQGNIVTGH